MTEKVLVRLHIYAFDAICLKSLHYLIQVCGAKTGESSAGDGKASRQETLLQELIETLNDSAGSLLLKFMSVITGKGQEDGTIQDNPSTESPSGSGTTTNNPPSKGRAEVTATTDNDKDILSPNIDSHCSKSSNLLDKPPVDVPVLDDMSDVEDTGSACEIDYAAEGDSSSDDDHQQGYRSLPAVPGHKSPQTLQATDTTTKHGSIPIVSCHENPDLVQAAVINSVHSSIPMVSGDEHPSVVQASAATSACSLYSNLHEVNTATPAKSVSVASRNIEPSFPSEQMPNIGGVSKRPGGAGLQYQITGHGKAASTSVISSQKKAFTVLPIDNPQSQKMRNCEKRPIHSSEQSARQVVQSNRVVKRIVVIPFSKGTASDPRLQSVPVQSVLPSGFSTVLTIGQSESIQGPSLDIPSMMPSPASKQSEIAPIQVNKDPFTFCNPDRANHQGSSLQTTQEQQLSCATMSSSLMGDDTGGGRLLQHPAQSADTYVTQTEQHLPPLPWIPNMKSFKKVGTEFR